MGVDDYLIRPIDKQELLARTNTQVRRSRYYDQLRSHVQAAMKLAITDPLTEFHNRRYFESQAGDLVKDAIKVGKSLSLLVVDIDHFKSVNDEHGHAAGDRVLQQMASRLKDSMRTTDMACRTGGEEFVIILPNTDADMAVGFAELMRLRVSGVPFQLGSGVDPLTVTVSIGVATARETDTIETILKRADLALYAAKRGGRDRVVYRGI
jgi:two-component system cell cycle response regulator